MIREACFVPSRGSRDSVPPASRSRRIDVWSAIVNDARREMFARVPTPSERENIKKETCLSVIFCPNETNLAFCN